MAFSAHALLIGVGQYQYASSFDVNNVVIDVTKLKEVLTDPATCQYPTAQVTILSPKGKAPTKANIQAELQQLAGEVRDTDTFLLFFAGHGVYGDPNHQYYLTTADTRFTKINQVEAGSGISKDELLKWLKPIKARQVLLIFNTCFSGNLTKSASLGDVAETLGDVPPADYRKSLLADGDGKVVLTACREQQRSYYPLTEQPTFFTQALLDGLRGNGTHSNQGYVGIFDLYSYVYDTVKRKVEQEAKVMQEPGFTALDLVGTFPVAVYQGTPAGSLGTFDLGAEARPSGEAVTLFSSQQIQYAGNNLGQGNTVRGDVHQVDTGGGAHITDSTFKADGPQVFGGRAYDMRGSDNVPPQLMRSPTNPLLKKLRELRDELENSMGSAEAATYHNEALDQLNQIIRHLNKGADLQEVVADLEVVSDSLSAARLPELRTQLRTLLRELG